MKIKSIEPTISGASIFHPDEWAARLELAACYRIFAMLGWTEMIYNHITIRLPDSVTGGALQFLINPFGLHYTEVCASNLLRVDETGRVIDASRYKPNPAGMVLHRALHQGLPQAHCVMHTHTTAGVAVASSARGIDQHNFYGAQLYQRVAYHDFEGVTLYPEEGERLLRHIGDRQAVVLRNHGLLSWGLSLAQAFAILWTMQRACEVQCAMSSLGESIPISDRVASQCSADALQLDQSYGAGRDMFDALCRQIDRIDESYKL
ncbi:MAG: class II aldolase/adducin family protein [Burkholderiaceae bacterium]